MNRLRLARHAGKGVVVVGLRKQRCAGVGPVQHMIDEAAKVATARTLWVPAINNQGGFGRWASLEIDDPWDAQRALRQWLAQVASLV